MTLTYVKSLAGNDLTYQVVWSTDLSNWSNEGVIDVSLTSAGGVETREPVVPPASRHPTRISSNGR